MSEISCLNNTFQDVLLDKLLSIRTLRQFLFDIGHFAFSLLRSCQLCLTLTGFRVSEKSANARKMSALLHELIQQNFTGPRTFVAAKHEQAELEAK